MRNEKYWYICAKLGIGLVYTNCSLIPLVTWNATLPTPLFPYFCANKGIREVRRGIFVTKGIRFTTPAFKVFS